jgi:angiotensin-converting enzyme
MLATKRLVTVFSVLAAGVIVAPVFALKVTESAAASHGYPGLCDMNGKKLADGEFRQWVENDRLHVVITYKFSATGEDISTRAMMDYFKPLMSWLEEQNKGRQIGWD